MDLILYYFLEKIKRLDLHSQVIAIALAFSLMREESEEDQSEVLGEEEANKQLKEGKRVQLYSTITKHVTTISSEFTFNAR